MSLITRLVFWELVKVSLLSLAAVTALLTLSGAMLEATRKGLDPLAVLAILPLLVPPTLPYTIPTCLLFATTFVYSRMSSNLEIVALKAGGINAARILGPGLAMGVAVAALSMGLTDRFIPWCNRKIADVLLADVQSAMFAYLKQNNEIVLPDFPYEIYVKEVRGDRLVRPVFKHRANGGFDMIAMADEATLNVHLVADQKLTDAKVVLGLMQGVVSNTRQGGSFYFEKKAFDMPMPPLAHVNDEKLENASVAQCLARSERKRAELAGVYLEVAANMTDAMLGGVPAIAAAPDAHAIDRGIRLLRKSRESLAEVHLRCSLAAVAFPFVLLGCPIGILYQRRDFLHTFFLCFLPVITLYFPALILAFNVYKEGTLPSEFVLWAPIATALLISLPFLRRVIRF